MGLRDYTKLQPLSKEGKNILNVVIGIYQKGVGEEGAKYVNKTLEIVQNNLKNKKDTIVNIAYVYGDDIVCVKNFSEVNKNTDNMYVEYCMKKIKLSHVWFASMALFENEKDDNGKNLFILIVDRQIERSDENVILAAEKSGRYNKLIYGIEVIFTEEFNENREISELEKYIINKLNGKVIYDNDLQ